MDDELPPEHVVRVYPPWRDVPLQTECGCPVDDDNALSAEDFYRKIREYGETRARHLFCTGCWNRAHAYSQKEPRNWDVDPIAVVSHDLTRYHQADDSERELQTRELRVLALLAEAHRAEFDDAMASLADMPDVAALARNRRAAADYRKNSGR